MLILLPRRTASQLRADLFSHGLVTALTQGLHVYAHLPPTESVFYTFCRLVVSGCLDTLLVGEVYLVLVL